MARPHPRRLTKPTELGTSALSFYLCMCIFKAPQIFLCSVRVRKLQLGWHFTQRALTTVIKEIQVELVSIWARLQLCRIRIRDVLTLCTARERAVTSRLRI